MSVLRIMLPWKQHYNNKTVCLGISPRRYSFFMMVEAIYSSRISGELALGVQERRNKLGVLAASSMFLIPVLMKAKYLGIMQLSLISRSGPVVDHGYCSSVRPVSHQVSHAVGLYRTSIFTVVSG